VRGLGVGCAALGLPRRATAALPPPLERFVEQLAKSKSLAYELVLLASEPNPEKGAPPTVARDYAMDPAAPRVRVELGRPNRARLRVLVGGKATETLLCDGKRLRQWSDTVFNDEAAPATLAGIAPVLDGLAGKYWPAFLHLQPELVTTLLRIEDEGAEAIDGRPTHRIGGDAYDSLDQPTRVTLWLDDETGWPMRYRYAPGSKGRALVFGFANHSPAALPAGTFTGAPPAGRKVTPPHPEYPRLTVGAPAPDFSLATLLGDQTTLADFKGQVLLLEFWAPW
jgi:hypothetical protein